MCSNIQVVYKAEEFGDSDTDKRYPNGITRCQSMMVNEDLADLVTVHAHNGLNRVKGKFSFPMVVREEQKDLQTSLQRVWHTRKRLSEREKGRSMAD